MQTWVLGILIVGVSVLLAHAGARLVRRKVPLPVLETHHEVAGFIIGVLGAVYAVLLAFVVVAVWNQFEEAKTTAEREANQLKDLSRMARGFTEPAEQQRLAAALLGYGRLVVDEEWEAMSRGEHGPRTQAALEEVWQAYREIEPKSGREQALYAESLNRLNEMSDSRRLRVFASRNDVPLVIRILMWGGALLTVGFTYFFGVKNALSQSLMTAALAGEIAFIIFLVVALDNPFHGHQRVEPEAMRQMVERMEGEKK